MSTKVFQFIPAFGQTITATTFLTTHAVAQLLAAKGIGGGISTLSFPDIGELRNMATTIWYDTMDASHLLFIDADMGFDPQIVIDMVAFGEPVVGAIYPQRKLPTSWAGSGTGEAATERRGGFMRVEGVGMGCTLIHRSAITIMLEKMPEIIDTRMALHPAADTMRQVGAHRMIRAFDKIDLPERGQVSEDLSFCLRWNRCGGQTWAAINYRMAHVGPYDFGACYLEHVQAMEAQAAAQQMQVQVQAALLAQTAGGTAITEPMITVGTTPILPPVNYQTEMAATMAEIALKPTAVPTSKKARKQAAPRRMPAGALKSAQNGSKRSARAAGRR